MNLTSYILSLFLIYIISFSPLASAFSSRDAYCNNTPFPIFCRSTLPKNTSDDSIYNYARMSIRHSLQSTQVFLSRINFYLRLGHIFSQTTLQALQDCQSLSLLNIDFLSNTLQNIANKNTLHSWQTDDFQTFLSATLTNQQTCLESLETARSSSTIRNVLLTPISNGSMLYSVSLALFKHGWVHSHKREQRWLTEDSNSGRKLLQVDENSSNSKLIVQIAENQVNVSQMVIVNQDGSGDFNNITAAVAAAPKGTFPGNGYFVIYIVAGIYEEYVSIATNKRYLMMIGDGINQTIITGNRSVVDNSTTYNSATFAVRGEGFVAVNITIRNTAGAIKHQAVALRNGADLSTFYNCSFEGYQDTLYAHSLRQFYRNCDIYGTVDFIFGNAAVVLQNCNIYPRLPMSNQFNAITAQGRTDINQVTGTSLHNCTIVPAQDLALSDGTTKTYLGRPWKEYSRTVIMQSYIDGFISPAGWVAWSGDFALNTLYYGEFNNTGMGSNTTDRVKWAGYQVMMNETDAANFTVSKFIFGDEWLKFTGVPYTGGLIISNVTNGVPESNIAAPPAYAPALSPVASPPDFRPFWLRDFNY